MENIKTLCVELKMSYIREYYQQHILEAKHQAQDYESFLFELLISERDQRRNNGIKHRIRLARFPQKKTLDTFD